VPTDGEVRVAATVRNSGDRAGTEVVQLYLSDPVASVVRPVRSLAGWARVRLAPGEAARVEFTVHADRTSFTGRELRRIVEPGVIEVAIGRSSADLPLTGSFVLAGPTRVLGSDRVLTVPVDITPVGDVTTVGEPGDAGDTGQIRPAGSARSNAHSPATSSVGQATGGS